MKSNFYSFIIPTFNRPDEVFELLESATKLAIPKVENFGGFEFIFCDGSPTSILQNTINSFSKKLTITHYHEPFLAISPARNKGANLANGNYIIFLDSDVILPSAYIENLHKNVLEKNPACFGGPDAARTDFTNIQKAINFAMTSYLTTGGIRGGKKQLHAYNPRGFNMGIRKNVFFEVGGYSNMLCGEDIELSIRILKAGYQTHLFPELYVFHKRRNTFKSFFRQVHRFGAARINIFYKHRSELKLTHLFPSVFMIGLLLGWLTLFFSKTLFGIYLTGFAIYFLAIFSQSALQNKSIWVGLLSVISSTLQLFGYGSGFILNCISVFVLGNKQGLALGASK